MATAPQPVLVRPHHERLRRPVRALDHLRRPPGIPGGYQSDELWSTPLFQSLLTLVDQGYTRDSVDQIMLESQFGLGSGLKMRDMANVIIATAQALQPRGPTPQVFMEKFLVHNIIVVPAANLTLGEVTVSEAGPNGAADPGEMVHLTVEIENLGTLAAESVSAVLSTSTPLVAVPQASSAYGDLPIGGSNANLVDFVIAIDPTFVCGDPIDLQLTVNYAEATAATTFSRSSLAPVFPWVLRSRLRPTWPFPTTIPTGSQSAGGHPAPAPRRQSNFNVDVEITHTYIGDLSSRCTPPRVPRCPAQPHRQQRRQHHRQLPVDPDPKPVPELAVGSSPGRHLGAGHYRQRRHRSGHAGFVGYQRRLGS